MRVIVYVVSLALACYLFWHSSKMSPVGRDKDILLFQLAAAWLLVGTAVSVWRDIKPAPSFKVFRLIGLWLSAKESELNKRIG